MLPDNVRQQFFQQKTGITVAESVILIAAVKPIERVGIRGLHTPMHYEHANKGRYFLPVNQIVEHRGGAVLDAVLENHDGSGPGRVILFGNVHPVIAEGPGKDLAGLKTIFCHLSFRNARLRLGIGRWLIIIGPEGGKGAECQ